LDSLYQGYAKNAYPWLISYHRSAVQTSSNLHIGNDPLYNLPPTA
jgi:hypothetical protein